MKTSSFLHFLRVEPELHINFPTILFASPQYLVLKIKVKTHFTYSRCKVIY